MIDGGRHGSDPALRHAAMDPLHRTEIRLESYHDRYTIPPHDLACRDPEWDRELNALTADMRARLARTGWLIAADGLERVGAPHVRQLTGPLWEIRLSGRDGVARALCVGPAGGGARVREEDPAHAAPGDQVGAGSREGGIAMSTLEELHGRWSRDADYRESHERLGAEFELARALVEDRARAGMTQADLAARMKTTRSAVARLEGGRVPPSTRTLERVARTTGTRLRIQFDPV